MGGVFKDGKIEQLFSPFMVILNLLNKFTSNLFSIIIYFSVKLPIPIFHYLIISDIQYFAISFGYKKRISGNSRLG